NAQTGALTAIGIPVAVTSGPSFVTVHPSGKFAYVVGSSSSTTVFSIDQATGTLFHVNDVPSGVSAVAMAVETTGKFAYIANFNDSSISVFSINQTTGDLTLIDT